MAIKRKATVKDVAELAGVSLMTVSRVLNKKGYTSKATVKKVQQAVSDLGYVANALARGMNAGKSMIVGIPVPASSEYYVDIVGGLYSELSRHNYLLTIGWDHGIEPFKDERGEGLGHIRQMLEHRVDGLIIRPTVGATSVEYFKEVKAHGIPMVCVDRNFADVDCAFVGSDDVWAAGEAARILLERGHSKVLHLTIPQNISTVIDRKKGFKEAFDSLGGESYYEVTAFIKELDWVNEVEVLIKNKEITAIFAFNDVIASMLMKELGKRGISIPNDVSVVGFGNLPVSKWTSPELATFDQKPKILGKEAGELLYKLMNEPDDYLNSRKILIRPEWVEGESLKEIN